LREPIKKRELWVEVRGRFADRKKAGGPSLQNTGCISVPYHFGYMSMIFNRVKHRQKNEEEKKYH
jgi:hypothetical protein